MVTHSTPRSNELQDVFLAFHQKFVIALRKEAEKFKFSISQLETLRFIVDKKNPTMKDIASYLGIAAPSATTLVEHLAHKGLIKRENDTEDRRTIRITATPKAEKLFLTFKTIKGAILSTMLKSFSAKEKNELAALLKKII